MAKDNEKILKLNDWLSMNREGIMDGERLMSSFVVRNGITVFINDDAHFKYYINHLYDEMFLAQKLISRKKITDLILDNYIKVNTEPTYECDIIKQIDEIQIEKMHVLLPVFFVHMHCETVKFGENRFVKFQDIIKVFNVGENEIFNGMIDLGNDKYFYNVPFADIVVEARDFDYAYEQAQIKLEEIVHICNYMLYSGVRGAEVISSTTNSGTQERKFIIGEESSNVYSGGHSPLVKRVCFEDAEDFMLNEEYGNLQLWKIYDKRDKNEIEIRIVNAVNWIGMAIAEKNNSIAFTQAVFAIESLLQRQTKGEIFNKSIVASIAEDIAFLIGRDFEERKKYEKDFKDIYAIRSKIAHGKSSEITAYQVLDVINMAKLLIQELLINPVFKEATTMQKITNYITKQRYTVGIEKENK